MDGVLLKKIAEFSLVAFTSIFFIINPFANSTIFVSLCEGMSHEQRRMIARRATVTAAVTLVVFAVMGNVIFKLFGIGLPAFKVAGGIIVFGIGYKMLRGKMATEKHSPEDINAALEKDDFALVPLAIPMLAGPGAISTVMVLMGEFHHWLRFPIIFLAIALSLFLTYLILWQADWLAEKISPVAQKTIARIMGMILCVIAVQFALNGIADFTNTCIH